MPGGWRTFGLLALYVGAQVVALGLALPFKAAGLTTTANPNSPAAPLFIFVVIIIAPLVLLFLVRRARGVSVLRGLILLVIAASLDFTLTATFGILTPQSFFLPPVGAGELAVPAIPLAAIVAVGFFVALLMEPQWYVVDIAGFVAAGALIALLGISFGILPAFVLLAGLAIYDAVAVYGTKHMVSLAEVVTDMKLPILMVMPTRSGYDYTTSPTFTTQRSRPAEDREATFMGLGDVVIPGVLVVSAFVWLPAHPLVVGVGANLWSAVGALVGSLLGYGVLMRLIRSGHPQAGLPLLNAGALGGYVLSYLLLFHNASLGIVWSF